MAWELNEAIAYYKSQGAPQDQLALIQLLKEIQRESTISPAVLQLLAEAYGIQESYLRAVIRRIPSLRLADSHLLEICAGANCKKSAALAACAEKLQRKDVTVKRTACMRLCGKGPNIRWDGKVYHHADEALLRQLFKE